MPTVAEVNEWILANILDASAWVDNQTKQQVAATQAERNLARWYPDAELTTELIAYQSVWELQGIDPALKYQKQGVKAIRDRGEGIDYLERDKISPEVKELLGEAQDQSEYVPLYGGELL